ncbi:CAP domain-containing protein [Herpetosiphon giganteus]|uniref:CAP domain-containing protein n=1 Tax=Herpetosiphon giganteus TaxID=2029754 RepID=UPI00195B53A0|nr:CAP domain-containing protein [Herpetosiphon giganteus]MBM7842402.1 uncharacterized protein YkwD [Herpetosiphon giganteus]
MANSLRGLGLVLFGLVLGVIIGVWWVAPRLNGTVIRFESATNPTASPSVLPTLASITPASTATTTSSETTTPSVAASATSQASPTTAPTIQVTASLTSSGDLKLDVLLAVNRERQKTDCVALVFEPRLQSIAQAHADDMAQHQKIDHVSSDGRTYSERLEQAGYQFIRRGENISAWFATPAEVVAQWMDEPVDGPHRANITNCAYRHVGIGLAYAEDRPYWVLDMAEPKP